MLKRAYQAGAEQAADDMNVPQEQKPSLLRRIAPFAAAAAAGGLAYKGLRTPTFSKNPALRKMQEMASRDGFHRVVDVTNQGKLGPKAPLGERIQRAILPQADARTGKMDLANRIKFWLHEGDEAVPVAHARDQLHVANREGKGPINVKGMVSGRNMAPAGSEAPMRNVVRGGVDMEGDMATQRALTQLGEKGKLFEANLMNKHAPDSIPETWTDLSSHFNGLNTKTPASRVQAAKELQARMHGAYGQGGKFMLKPSEGLQSGGAFPWSHDDWGEALSNYNKHVSNPANRAALHEAEQLGGGDLAGYLGSNNLLSGHTLHNALQNPKSVFAQRAIENPMGEWRVHSINGAAPQTMMAPRFNGADLKEVAKNAPAYAGMGKIKTEEMQKFVEDTVSRLPPKYRQGTYGMDVMPHQKPDGSIGYKVIEMNPAERAHGDNPGGMSGFLDSSLIPYMGHAHYRAMTGRHTQPIAGLGGLAAAAAAGGATHALMNRKRDAAEDPTDEPQSPNPSNGA